jgi:hypothetical protein
MVDGCERIPEISQVFDRLIAEHGDDATRPVIEVYRSRRELILLSPVPASVAPGHGDEGV